jgi:hypothetical protein
VEAGPWAGLGEGVRRMRRRGGCPRTITCRQRTPLVIHTHTLIRWYLRDRYFDVEEAEEKLTKMQRWKKDFQ